MFTHAFLQEHGFGKLGREEELLRAELERRGLAVSLYTTKKILRRQLPLGAHTFIAGDLHCMRGAMQQLGIPVPAPNDYPACLRPFLCRHVWRSTLGAMEMHFLNGEHGPVFIKPADRCKNFTGRVFSSSEDFRVIGEISRRQEIWCAEPVEWLAEYRVYVVDQRVVWIALYHGEIGQPLDDAVLESALAAYHASGEAPAAYGIDFGVLAGGRTALVEANDGFSLGAYPKITAAAYADVLLTRWQQLLATAESSAFS
jgi:hypothetical protein